MSKNTDFDKPSLNELFALVRHWANNKGIYDNGDIKTQTLKLVEEVGELSKAVLKSDDFEIQDAIGDCIVVLINVAELYNKETELKMSGSYKYSENSQQITAESCLLDAYNIISKRKGKMQNGTFIKEQ